MIFGVLAGHVVAVGRQGQVVSSSRGISSMSSFVCWPRSHDTATRSSRKSKIVSGTVYPTLTMLEDLGYARAMPEEGGRKIYEITDEGRKHLEEHSATVDDIFERIAKFVEGFFDAPMADLKRSMASLGRATFYVASRSPNDKDRLAKISEILKRAAVEIEKLTQEETASAAPKPSSGETQL